MTTWNRVQGDLKDTIVVTLNGIADLTAVTTIEGHVWKGTEHNTLTASVLSAVACTVTVNLGGVSGWLADATPGFWRFETQATFSDETVLTWPADTPDMIYVRTQGDDPAS